MTKKRFFHKDEYAEIPFSNAPGEYFKVDAEYGDEFRKHIWSRKQRGGSDLYRVATNEGKSWRHVHPIKFTGKVAFKNGDALDLRIKNLVESKSSKTKYNYVYKQSKSKSRFHVILKVKKQDFSKSGFDSPEDAAWYVDEMIIENRLDSSKLNFPESLQRYQEETEIETSQENHEKPETFTLATKINDEYYYIEGFSSEKDLEKAEQVIGEMLRNSEKEVIKYVEVVKPSLMKRWFGKTVQE